MSGGFEGLAAAIRSGNEAIVRECVQRGLSVEAKDAVGGRWGLSEETHSRRTLRAQMNNTALLLAAQSGHIHIVRYLVAKGASQSAVNRVRRCDGLGGGWPLIPPCVVRRRETRP